MKMYELNSQTNALLVAHYHDRLRVTLSPPARRLAGSVWSAGQVEDWCELARDGAGAAEEVASSLAAPTAGMGRVARQRNLHTSLYNLGLCNRPAPHWPEREETT